MRRYNIEELKLMRESEDHVEFKKGEHGNVSYNGGDKQNPKDRRRCILGYVIALCNEGGGRMVIGMHDDYPHRVVGTKQSLNALGQLESSIYNDTGIRPDVYELYENPDQNQGRVLIIEVPGRPVGKVFKFEDVPLMRVGEDLKPMSDAMYLKILQESEPDFSERICEGLTVNDLDENAIAEMKRQYAIKWNKPEFRHIPTLQVLSDFQLIDADGRLNYAALILLGNSASICKYLPCNNVVVEYRLYHSMIEYTARKEFQEPLFLLVDSVWQYINQPASNPLQHYRDKFNIYDLPTFNEIVVREALLNAVCHRLMHIQSDVVIKQYPDMLVITNAGGFPVGVDINNVMTVNSMPRSKRISEVLQKTGLVEKSGQGVDKMYALCISEGKAIPDYSATDDFQVSLKIRGNIQDAALLLLIKEEQENRTIDNKLNAFDLLALYRVSRQENLKGIDGDTISKLLAENLIVLTDEGYAITAKYHEMQQRAGIYTTTTEKGRDKGVGGNLAVTWRQLGNNPKFAELTDTQRSIVVVMAEDKSVTAKRLAATLHVPQRTIEREISRLKNAGIILRKGTSNNGHWEVAL